MIHDTPGNDNTLPEVNLSSLTPEQRRERIKAHFALLRKTRWNAAWQEEQRQKARPPAPVEDEDFDSLTPAQRRERVKAFFAARREAEVKEAERAAKAAKVAKARRKAR